MHTCLTGVDAHEVTSFFFEGQQVERKGRRISQDPRKQKLKHRSTLTTEMFRNHLEVRNTSLKMSDDFLVSPSP